MPLLGMAADCGGPTQATIASRLALGRTRAMTTVLHGLFAISALVLVAAWLTWRRVLARRALAATFAFGLLVVILPERGLDAWPAAVLVCLVCAGALAAF